MAADGGFYAATAVRATAYLERFCEGPQALKHGSLCCHVLVSRRPNTGDNENGAPLRNEGVPRHQ